MVLGAGPSAGSSVGDPVRPGLQAVRASPECIPRARSPMAPLNLIWLVLLVDLQVFLILPVNLLLFWNRVACNFITLYS